jgi:hypothetical protein
MPQLQYNYMMNVGSAGELYDIGYNNVLTPVATQTILMGLGVAKVVGQDMQVRLPVANVNTITLTGTFVTGNSIVPTVNGVALAAVPYDTTSAQTLTDIATAIAAVTGIASAVANLGVLTVTAHEGYAAVVSLAVTGGASQPTFAYVYSSLDSLYGVALYIQNKMNLLGPQGSAGGSPYYSGDPVSMLTRGRVWVTVYLRFNATMSNPQVGSFRADADSGNALLVPASQARWLVGASAGGLAVLELNQP